MAQSKRYSLLNNRLNQNNSTQEEKEKVHRQQKNKNTYYQEKAPCVSWAPQNCHYNLLEDCIVVVVVFGRVVCNCVVACLGGVIVILPDCSLLFNVS